MLLWFNITENRLWCAFYLTYKKGAVRIQEVILFKRLGWYRVRVREAAQWADTCHTSVRPHIQTGDCIMRVQWGGDRRLPWSFAASHADMQSQWQKEPALSKEEGKDWQPKLSSDFHMCFMTCAHLNSHISCITHTQCKTDRQTETQRNIGVSTKVVAYLRCWELNSGPHAC